MVKATKWMHKTSCIWTAEERAPYWYCRDHGFKLKPELFFRFPLYFCCSLSYIHNCDDLLIIGAIKVEMFVSCGHIFYSSQCRDYDLRRAKEFCRELLFSYFNHQLWYPLQFFCYNKFVCYEIAFYKLLGIYVWEHNYIHYLQGLISCIWCRCKEMKDRKIH